MSTSTSASSSTSSSNNNIESLILDTLTLLTFRLQRLELLINGTVPGEEDASTTIRSDQNAIDGGQSAILPRVQNLEQALHRLAGREETVADLWKLRMCLLGYCSFMSSGLGGRAFSDG